MVFAMVGVSLSMLVVLSLFVLATFITWTLPWVDVEELAAENSLEILTKGWKIVAKQRNLNTLLVAHSLEIFANTIWVSSVILVFVTKILHQTESYWRYTNATYSVGIILGGFLLYRFSEKVLQYKWQSIIVSLLLMEVITFLIVKLPFAGCFLVLSASIGFVSQLKEIAESVLIQEAVPDNKLVNVYSVFEVMSTLAFAIFTFIMSSITDNFGVVTIFELAIVCLFLEALWIFSNRRYLY